MLPFDRGDSFIWTENAIWAIVLVRTLQYSNITIRIEKQQQDDEKDHEDNSKYRGRRQASHGGDGDVIDSHDHVRSPSPISACSNISPATHDVKVAEFYRMRVLELERELRLARLEDKPTTPMIEQKENPFEAAKETPRKSTTTVMQAQPTTTTLRRPTTELPRVELTPFDGEPGGYWKFIRQFENFVECDTGDPGQRFLYLMHYCRGKAKEAIEECVMLPVDEGYARAREILQEHFGQPFQVARTLIDGMLGEAKRIRGNPEALSKLALKMQNCQIALGQMNYEADLNALHTLESVVRYLPADLQTRWADKAEEITRGGRETSFKDLTEFITQRSRVVNSRFGQLAKEHTRPGGSGQAYRERDGARNHHWANPNAVSTKAEVRDTGCRLCNEAHHLYDCPTFQRMQVPERWAAAKRLGSCFICLSYTHRAATCKIRTRCNKDGCRAGHHQLLHASREDTTGDQRTNSVVCSATRSTHKAVRLGVIAIGVETPRGTVRAWAFLDNGSDTTLVTDDFARRHNLDGQPASLVLSTVGGTKTTRVSKLRLNLVSESNGETIEVPEAYTVRDLPMRAMDSIQAYADRFPHLAGVHFNEVDHDEVDLLLGCDVPEAHWILDQRKGGRREPYAIHTVFGWALCGAASENKGTASVNCMSGEEQSIENDIRRMYNREFDDLADDREFPSQQDKTALSIVESGTRSQACGFEVPLPWRPDRSELPNNFEVAVKRLGYLKKRLSADPGLSKQYVEAMQRNETLGYIERVDESLVRGERLWYLPHHPVTNPKKPGKVRIVFDCASKYRGLSLNDCILQGPDWTTPLLEVLCRFRLGDVAVAADIQEMFLQVKVPSNHRDALRLLWWPNGDLNEQPVEYRMTVHPFGAVSSPFCANYALRQTACRYGSQFPPTVTTSVTDSFYVDDFLRSFDDVDSAIEHMRQLTNLLKLGGFRLTKWLSNSRATITTIPEIDRAPSVLSFDTEPLPTEPTLGVRWNAETDRFVFQLQLPSRSVTRRGLLSSVSSLYDPIGFVSPWLLPGKILLQQLCRKGSEWDEPLGEQDRKEWADWVGNLACAGEIEIPRPLPRAVPGVRPELHVFSDASETGYGAVAYGYWRSSNGVGEGNILFAKARVTPLKCVSIPRLELNAAVLSVRIGRKLEKCFPMIDWDTTFWTDSAIVLHYINNTSTRFSTFVANRLTVIHEGTKVRQWRHVRTNDNPADYCSRGLKSLDKLQNWLHGPGFLTSPPDTWPDSESPTPPAEQIETKRTVLHADIAGENPLLEKTHHFSCWTKLLRAFAWLARFKRKLLIMNGCRPQETLNLGPLLPRELERAECDVLRLLQARYFPAEIDKLSEHLTASKRDNLKLSPLRRLNPIFVNGLLRVGGRLGNSSLDFEAKHPIILPHSHHVVTLLVQHFHAREGHAGTNHLLNSIRRRFWIVKGRTVIKGVVNKCLLCRRQNALACGQRMAPLPDYRVRAGWWPFVETGVDYFGPIPVKRGKVTEKRYGCVLTCMQTRAVHLEVAHTMSTDSFLMALQRFMGRRGTPKNIYSDNGSNFVGASREMQRWLPRVDQTIVADRLATHGVRWQFNPPYASHRGGVWERMIRSIRRTLLGVCGQQLMNDETLSTVLIEVERILNDRPLTPASDECGSLALSPNHLLLLRPNPGLDVPRTISAKYSTGWRQANYLAGVFWRRWTREYLPTLQTRQKWLSVERPLRVGDVVLIADERCQRNEWPLGVIKECHAGDDGLVRTVTVKTAQGDVLRDVRRICFLEGDGEAPNGRSNAVNSTGQPVTSAAERPNSACITRITNADQHVLV